MSRETVGDEVRSGDLTVDGNVGIGTTNPGSRLHIQASGSNDVLMGLNSEPAITFRDGTGKWFHVGKEPGSDALVFSDGGTPGANERMRIDNAGNVGIGTSSPQTKLSVSGDLGVGANAGVFANLYYNGGFKYLGDGYGALFKVSNENGDLGLYAAPNNVSGAGAAATLTERFRVSNAGLIAGSGTSLGAWTAYTPTLGGTGWAIGNGTAAGYYCQIGRVVHFKARVTFGTTSTYGASEFQLTLPLAANTTYASATFAGFSTRYVDTSASLAYAGRVALASASNVLGKVLGTSGKLETCSSTAPFTWASTDLIEITGTYEAA